MYRFKVLTTALMLLLANVSIERSIQARHEQDGFDRILGGAEVEDGQAVMIEKRQNVCGRAVLTLLQEAHHLFTC